MLSLQRFIGGAAALAAAAVSVCSPAHATVTLTYALDNDVTCGTCTGPAPFGTVTISQAAAGDAVDFSVTFTNAATTFAFSGSHDAFSFSLAPGSTIAAPTSLTALPTGFKLDTTPSTTNDAPYGYFNVGIKYTSIPVTATSLSFELADTGLLSASDFMFSVAPPSPPVHTFQAALFEADIVTGPTSASGAVAAVPEVSTWAMLVLGFAAVGFVSMRRTWQVAGRFA